MFRSYLLIFISFLVISCNDYQKLLNSPENEVNKYTAAEEYYQNGEFRRANSLIEQIIPSYRGKPQGERLVFFFANSYFEIKTYYSAAIQFENFIKSYPNSQRVQEAYFMEAKSYFMLSPIYTLDQEDTFTGIDKLQLFINRFPNSDDKSISEKAQTQEVRFECRCSRQRSLNAMKMLDKKELEDILIKEGKAELVCEFCKNKYLINSEEIKEMIKN